MTLPSRSPFASARPGAPALRAARTFTLLVLTVALSGCGYFRSGTWEDDPKNFQRAFGSRQPPEVEVIHSRYTRYPHFTYEVVFYFQLRMSDAIARRAVEDPQYQQVEGPQAETAKHQVLDDAPAWFAPGDASRYEIWTTREPPGDNVILRDRRSGDYFIFFAQL